MSVKIRVWAAGEPRPMGSKSAYVRGGRAVVTDGPSGPAMRSWQAAVMEALRGHEMVTGAVCVRLTFSLRRPRGHYRPNGMLRDAAPSFPTVKPDLDKLVRSTLDALTMSGVIEDDARIWGLSASKQYAPLGCETGASIEIGKTEGGDE